MGHGNAQPAAFEAVFGGFDERLRVDCYLLLDLLELVQQRKHRGHGFDKIDPDALTIVLREARNWKLVYNGFWEVSNMPEQDEIEAIGHTAVQLFSKRYLTRQALLEEAR